MVDKAGAFVADRNFTINGQGYAARLLEGGAAGSTSLVYLAYALDPATNEPMGRPMVLKRFASDQKLFYQAEKAVLEGVVPIEQQQAQHHFPRLINHAEDQYFGGELSNLLLMEYAGDRPVRDLRPLEEDLALRLIAAYLDSLITLSIAGFTCWDRKLSDFFWSPPEPRDTPSEKLMVIDWNMASSWSAGEMINELRLAGRLLFELLTGVEALLRPGSTSYDLQPKPPVSDGMVQQAFRPWAQLSYGAQVAVENLIAGPGQLPDESDEAGQRKFLLDWTRKIARHCRRIAYYWLEDVKPLMDKASGLVHGDQWDSLLELSSVAALIEEASQAPGGWLERGPILEEYSRVHKEATAHVLSSRDYLAPARDKLQAEHITEAINYLMSLLTGVRNLTSDQELSVLRWFLLTKSIQPAMVNSMNFGRVVHAMQELNAGLRTGEPNPGDALQALAELGVVQSELRKEVELHGYVAAGDIAMQGENYTEARNAYRQALDLLKRQATPSDDNHFWESPQGILGRYWSLVRESLGDLSRQAQEAVRRALAIERPVIALAAARVAVAEGKFAAAEKELQEALRENQRHAGLLEALTVTRRLATLQKLVGDPQIRPFKDREPEEVIELLLVSDQIITDLPDTGDTSYSIYPHQVQMSITAGAGEVLEAVSAHAYPTDSAAAQRLYQRGLRLHQVLTQLWSRGVQVLQTKAQGDPGDRLLGSLARLSDHISRLNLLRDLRRDPRLTPVMEEKILQLAQDLSITTLPAADGEERSVAEQLAALQQAAKSPDHGSNDAKTAAIASLLREDLPKQTGLNDTWRLIDENKAALPAVNSGIAGQLRNWLNEAQQRLPQSVAELAHLHQVQERLIVSYDIEIGKALEELKSSISTAKQPVEQLLQSWPQALGERPSLESLYPTINEIQFWQRRRQVLNDRLRDSSIEPHGSELVRWEMLVRGLRECQQQLGVDASSGEQSLDQYERKLNQAWRDYYQTQKLPEAGEVANTVSSALTSSAEKLLNGGNTLQALWLAAAASALVHPQGSSNSAMQQDILATLESPEADKRTEAVIEQVLKNSNALKERVESLFADYLVNSSLHREVMQLKLDITEIKAILQKFDPNALLSRFANIESMLQSLQRQVDNLASMHDADAASRELERYAAQPSLRVQDLRAILSLLQDGGSRIKMSQSRQIQLMQKVEEFGREDAAGTRNFFREQYYRVVLLGLSLVKQEGV